MEETTQKRLKDQTLLAIEGAGQSVSIALQKEGKLVADLYLDTGVNSSEVLMQGLEQLIESAQTPKESLEGIVVGLGPGSFTSIRISLSTAEGLGVALGIPVYGKSSLEVIAGNLRQSAKSVKVIQNAYKGELYYEKFDCSGALPIALIKPELVTPQDCFDGLEAGDLLLGTGIAILEKKGFQLAEKNVVSAQGLLSAPKASVLLELVQGLEAKKPSIEPLEPVYIRASEAEINYAKNFGLDQKR